MLLVLSVSGDAKTAPCLIRSVMRSLRRGFGGLRWEPAEISVSLWFFRASQPASQRCTLVFSGVLVLELSGDPGETDYLGFVYEECLFISSLAD